MQKAIIGIIALATFSVSAQSIMKKSQWKPHVFNGKTNYKWQGQTVQASSNGTASGLFYEKKIDLKKTPVLTWRWKVDKNVAISNQKNKKGDDFAARIYVVKKNKLLVWKTIALNYVWSNKAKKGSSWKNPFTGNARMVVKRSAADSGWQTERVNLRADFKKYFGKDVDTIDAIAIMTDTDNSGGSAKAQYTGVSFSAQ